MPPSVLSQEFRGFISARAEPSRILQIMTSPSGKAGSQATSGLRNERTKRTSDELSCVSAIGMNRDDSSGANRLPRTIYQGERLVELFSTNMLCICEPATAYVVIPVEQICLSFAYQCM